MLAQKQYTYNDERRIPFSTSVVATSVGVYRGAGLAVGVHAGGIFAKTGSS